MGPSSPAWLRSRGLSAAATAGQCTWPLAILCALGTATWHGGGHAQDWVGPLSELSPPTWDLTDNAIPLATRIAAADALGRFGPRQDAETLLLASLDDGATPALRDAALRALSMRGSPAAVAPVLQILRDAEQPPGAAFLLLSAVADEAAIDAAIAQLGRPEMAAQAAWALRRIGPRAVPQLIDALAEDPLPAAIALLGTLGDARAIAPLRTRLRGPVGELRGAILDALGGLASARGADGTALEQSAMACVDADDPAVARAALRLLGAVGASGTEAGRRTLLQHLEHGPEDTRAEALAALCRAWPKAAAPRLRAQAAADSPARHVAALACLHEHPHPDFVPLLAEQLRGPSIEAAAGALARVEGGRGLSALLAAGREMPARAPLLGRAVAICLRIHGQTLPTTRLRAARAWLATLPDGARTRRLRALSRDPALADELPRRLRAQDPRARSEAALAARWMGPQWLSRRPDSAREVTRGLCGILTRDGVPEARRRAAAALRELRLGCRATPWAALLRQPAVAPEVALLLGATLGRDRHADPDRRLRRALRTALHPGSTLDARTRSAAALGLALAGERAAVTALSAALRDASDRVRLAAAIALRRLGGDAAREAMARQRRVERNRAVFEALSPGRSATHRLLAHGQEVLEVRVGVGHTPGTGGAVLVEVQLSDGRWLLLQTGEAGELIIPDLRAGHAELRVVR